MFRLTIKTDNAAFKEEPADEIVRILRDLADWLEWHAPRSGQGPLADVNGNTVGEWKLTGGDL